MLASQEFPGCHLFVYYYWSIYSHYVFASLTAHITAMYAVFIAIAVVTTGASLYLVALALAFIANLCMPLTYYGGSPGSIYYGAGYVTQGSCWKVGFIVSVVQLIIWGGFGSI